MASRRRRRPARGRDPRVWGGRMLARTRSSCQTRGAGSASRPAWPVA